MSESEFVKDEFFRKLDALCLAVTYDDVRLKTGYSEVMPDEVDLKSKFSRNIPLLNPLVSAAMDTVTEHELAIEMAKLGGIGVIHRGLSPEKQAYEVGRVKFYLNAKISKPICVSPDTSLDEIIKMRRDKGYEFQTFPVTDKNNKLLGILTKNDFEFRDTGSVLAKEIMTTEPVFANANTTAEKAYDIMHKKKKKMLPLVDENGLLAGMFIYRDVRRKIKGNGKPYNLDDNGQLRVAAAIGVGKGGMERAELLARSNVDAFVLDSAHADTKNIIQTIRDIKNEYPLIDLVVGNISEPESAKRLADHGVDGVKSGQGGGSICTTRIIAGIGCPQVTAVYNSSWALRGLGIPVGADGGLRYSGDIGIAIGAGADYVMMGSMLAGTTESPGDIVFRDGKQWKNYRGMGSLAAMEESKESRERYGQSDTGKSELIPEGIEGLTPFKGNLSEVIFQYLGGLRRTMGYVGAKDIAELQAKANFHRISAAGKDESHPHDVLITKEAPNYKR